MYSPLFRWRYRLRSKFDNLAPSYIGGPPSRTPVLAVESDRGPFELGNDTALQRRVLTLIHRGWHLRLWRWRVASYRSQLFKVRSMCVVAIAHATFTNFGRGQYQVVV